MSTVTIYHHPLCSKSRQTLALLREQGIEPKVVDYLQDPPDVPTLRLLLGKLGLAAEELVRKKDLGELGVAEPNDEAGWLQLMVEHPRVMQRPIVVVESRAVLGRPPENVLSIL